MRKRGILLQLLAYASGFQNVACCAAIAGLLVGNQGIADEPLQNRLAHWGSDPIGRPLPEYITGDECLFCHRGIGRDWVDNPHQTTMRLAQSEQPELQELAAREPSAAKDVAFLLGAKRMVRYLKRTQAYGRLDLLSAGYRPGGHSEDELHDGRLVRADNADNIVWDSKLFGERCIGCHTTAVDSQQQTFAATSLDCCTCHGEVVLEHSLDISKALLSRQSRNPQVVNSICSACHLRGGQSESSRQPYPNSFVPGDNLFRNFRVDLSDSAIAALPSMQQHIYWSARAVGIGNQEHSCIDCHNVHGNRSDQHMELKETAICNSCHVPDTGNRELIETIRQYDKFAAGNATCDY